MVARTHNVIAFACLLTAVVYYPQRDLTLATILVSLVANTAGSMLPDIDQATNKLWDMLPLGDSVGKVLSNALFGHRSFSHSLIGMFVVYKLVCWLFPMIFNGGYINSQIVALSIMIGYISHIVADGLTEEGIPLLFPLKNRFGFPPIKSWRIKTDHWFERLVIFPGMIVYVCWFSFQNWGTVLRLF